MASLVVKTEFGLFNEEFSLYHLFTVLNTSLCLSSFRAVLPVQKTESGLLSEDFLYTTLR